MFEFVSLPQLIFWISSPKQHSAPLSSRSRSRFTLLLLCISESNMPNNPAVFFARDMCIQTLSKEGSEKQHSHVLIILQLAWMLMNMYENKQVAYNWSQVSMSVHKGSQTLPLWHFLQLKNPQLYSLEQQSDLLVKIMQLVNKKQVLACSCKC